MARITRSGYIPYLSKIFPDMNDVSVAAIPKPRRMKVISDSLPSANIGKFAALYDSDIPWMTMYGIRSTELMLTSDFAEWHKYPYLLHENIRMTETIRFINNGITGAIVGTDDNFISQHNAANGC